MLNPFSKTYTEEDQKTFDFLRMIKFFERLRNKEMARFLPAMHQ
ncbi:MAG TPA: cyclic nucleotide-binding domain-containing protein, partial [Algoriphagus sp.]|nr:cyclic nucleotide-binding domain-containing protein [Algoriphagus sp.]